MYTIKFTCSADRFVEHYKHFDDKRDAYNYAKRCFFRAIEKHVTLHLVIYDSERSNARVCEMTNAYYDKPLQTIVAYPENPYKPVYVKF